jgi:hypothetical protein
MRELARAESGIDDALEAVSEQILERADSALTKRARLTLGYTPDGAIPPRSSSRSPGAIRSMPSSWAGVAVDA